MNRLPKVFRSAVTGKYHKWGGDISRTFEGGIVTTTDIADIEATVILDEVLGLARPQYKLRQACRVVRMDNLVANIDIATSLAGQEKVGELVEAEISKQAYTDMDFDLWKNVVHVVISDEAGKKASHDVLGMHISDAARDLARMENKQISEALDACDNQQAAAGGSASTHTWDTSTSGVSDANPWVDLLAAMIAIQGDGNEADTLVMHPQVWAGFITNDWVRNQVDVGLGTVQGSRLSLHGFPSVKIVTDFAVTPITSCYVLSKTAPALVFGEGPTAAARYRDEKAGYDGYVIRQWLQPQIIDFGTGVDAIVDITGAHS